MYLLAKKQGKSKDMEWESAKEGEKIRKKRNESSLSSGVLDVWKV